MKEALLLSISYRNSGWVPFEPPKMQFVTRVWEAHSEYMDPGTRKRGRPKLLVTEEVIERRRLSKQERNSRRSGLPGTVPCETSCGNPASEVNPGIVPSEISSANPPNEVISGPSSGNAIPCEISGANTSTQIINVGGRKRGRPRLTMIRDVVERRRLSKQRSNSRRSYRSGSSQDIVTCESSHEIVTSAVMYQVSRKRGRPRLPVNQVNQVIVKQQGHGTHHSVLDENLQCESSRGNLPLEVTVMEET